MKFVIDSYSFEFDDRFNIHVYLNFEYFDIVEVGYSLDYEEFKYKCNEWLINH